MVCFVVDFATFWTRVRVGVCLVGVCLAVRVAIVMFCSPCDAMRWRELRLKEEEGYKICT